MFTNSAFNKDEFELLKEEVSQDHESNHLRFKETLIENVHFNVYREHMMGQPIKGDRDLTHTLTVDQARDYLSTNFFGDNLVVIGVGNINHEEFVNQVNQSFQNVPKQTANKIKNKERPIYIPALLFIRDDEMVNSNVGVFYDAPSIKDPDYYSFLLLQ
jgi:predicted Zn-dependent peptidase